MIDIQMRLHKLFEFEKKLHLLLDEQQYGLFNQHQALFGDLLRDFLKKHATSELNSVVEELTMLKSRMAAIQARAVTETQQLKEKTLLLQRNKNKIKAYL